MALEELQGFPKNYTVMYNERDVDVCPDILSGTIFVEKDSALIVDLVPSSEYCVRVAASTAAGVGKYSQGQIPCKTALCEK